MLEYIKGLGRPLTPLREFPESGPAVFLRHDIDFSVIRALRMAEADSEVGARSTFFVLLTAPFYNALSVENVDRLRKIVDLGHEVGLHYDCSALEGLSQERMSSRLRTLVRVLEEAIGTKVSSISQHKPASSKIRPSIPGFRDAYGSHYFGEETYLSDSRMRFGRPDVFRFFEENERCQVLIHPVWWNEQRLSLSQVFESLAREMTVEARSHLDEFRLSIEAYYRKNQIF